MGRTALIFLVLIFVLAKAAAFDFSYTCSKDFDDYYFGGEYLYFYCTIRPDSSSDAKKMAGIDYEVKTALDEAAIQVEVKFENGRVMLHPRPDDSYSTGNITVLKFHVPELDEIDRIIVRIQGHVPILDVRLENVTAISVYGGEKLFTKTITVVNKQRFYDDFRSFGKSRCVDDDRLIEAKAYFNDGKYVKAEKLMEELEKKVRECELKAEREKYEDKLDKVKENLTDLKKDLMVFELTVERDSNLIENYAEIVSGLADIKAKVSNIERLVSDAGDLIDEGKFSTAEEKMQEASTKISELKQDLKNLEASVKKKQTFDWMLVVAVAAAIVLGAVIALILSSRRKDKW